MIEPSILKNQFIYIIISVNQPISTLRKIAFLDGLILKEISDSLFKVGMEIEYV
jgi:hypothetical protein